MDDLIMMKDSYLQGKTEFYALLLELKSSIKKKSYQKEFSFLLSIN